MSTINVGGDELVAPEVRLFLARVRRELADLDPAEVEEITDGLEADLAELVADRGPGALGSPGEYAAELRSAAGLVARPRPGRRSPLVWGVDAASARLDGARERFDALVDVLPGDQRPLLDWARPLWWIFRAWVLVVAGIGILKDAAGLGNAYYVPDLIPPVRGFGWLVTLVAVVVSVQVGRGRLWPGGRRGIGARIALLALNVLALALIPVAGASVRNEPDYGGSARAVSTASAHDVGLTNAGKQVTNIYPYDASGKPLVGVQLLDQDGDPIEVAPVGTCRIDGEDGWLDPTLAHTSCFDDETGSDDQAVRWRVTYPWSNGAAQVRNVFPMPTRLQGSPAAAADAFAQPDPPKIDAVPEATVPPVSLPGIVASLRAGDHRAK